MSEDKKQAIAGLILISLLFLSPWIEVLL